MNTSDKEPRKIDDPELNQDASTYDKDESFDDTDDFHKYDDTRASNLEPDDPIVKSDDHTNKNARTNTPTFTRTYDKNVADDAGRYDGNIAI